MGRFIIKRILWMIPVLLGVILIVYAISFFAPGDPIMSILGTTNYSPERYAELQAYYGLDKPFFIQYVTYIKNIVTHFDFGTSYAYSNSISKELLSRIPYSLKLGALSILVMVIIAIPVGVVSAVRQNHLFDRIATVISMFLAGMPNFWLGMMLVLLFAIQLGWLPAAGVGKFSNWILPVLSLSLTSMASTLRMTRSSMLEMIRQDYVRTARAKGLSNFTTIVRHVLKNALIPVITVIGMQFGMIVGGSVVIESVFNLPGVGNYMMTAINNRDYPAINGCVLVLAFSICVVNLIVDILYAYVDPRIKAQYEAQQKNRLKNRRALKAAEAAAAANKEVTE